MSDKKRKILLIEDDKVDRMLFERFVARKGLPYDYTIVGSVAETTNILESEKFDVVLADCFLGDGTAFDLFKKIKDIPIIIVTGAGNEELAVKAMKAGAYDYLIKDSAGNYLKTLSVTLNNTFERKNAEEELDKYRKHLESLVEERTAELANVNEELRRSNADLEQFAYIASHDLRAPLRTISNFAQLLAKRYKGKFDSDGDKFIDYIINGATCMHDLIDDLLSYSQVSTRRKKSEPVNCDHILKQVTDNLQFAIKTSNAVITYDSLPIIMGDFEQIMRLFQNLLSNAIKFCKNKQPEIRISGERKEDGKWLFSVSDNGIGIDAQFFERIFVIFQRLHSVSEYSGTGIGLSICRKIVERHGGDIWVESEWGKGSTFYFTMV